MTDFRTLFLFIYTHIPELNEKRSKRQKVPLKKIHNRTNGIEFNLPDDNLNPKKSVIKRTKTNLNVSQTSKLRAKAVTTHEKRGRSDKLTGKILNGKNE